MPSSPAWSARGGQILATINRSAAALFSRRDVELIFGIGSRAAQILMMAAGAERVGGRNSLVVGRRLLLTYVAIKTGQDSRELNRRRRLALMLAEPQVLVEAREETPEVMARVRLSDIPWLKLAPGSVTITFSNSKEALLRLLCFAKSLGDANLKEFEERTKLA